MSERIKVSPASFVLLLEKDTVLLTRRCNTGYMDGFYSAPAGHFEEGELPDDCARRECQEEVGVNPINLQFSSVVYNTIGTRGAYVDFFFTGELGDQVPVNKEPDKCDSIGFFPLNGLPENLTPEVLSALENIKEGRPYSKV